MPAPHPPEFRQRAVELAGAGHNPLAQLAKDLRISESCLRNWMAQANADENGSATRLAAAQKKDSPSCAGNSAGWSWKARSSNAQAAFFARQNGLSR